MATWQPPTKQPQKTKDVLRAMLRQAVENTNAPPEKQPKPRKDEA